MKHPFSKFEEYCKFALLASARIAKLENHSIITADDVFLGIMMTFMENHLEDSFRALIGIHENQKLDAHLETLDDKALDYELIHQEQVEPDHYHFQEEIQTLLQPYIDHPSKNLDLQYLLKGVLPYLSSETKALLKTKKTNYSKIIDTTNKLDQIPIIKELWFINFLDTLDEMLKQLNLDYSQLENMQIKIWTSEDLNALFNSLEEKISQTSSSMESEIVEKSESDKKSDQSSVSTSDPKGKKKEEKSLPSNILGQTLPKKPKMAILIPLSEEKKK